MSCHRLECPRHARHIVQRHTGVSPSHAEWTAALERAKGEIAQEAHGAAAMRGPKSPPNADDMIKGLSLIHI